jgi:hypothetical protein
VLLYLGALVASKRSTLLVYKLVAVFVLLQLVLNAGWLLGINPLPNRHAAARNYLDMCHGSLGSQSWEAYIMICLLFFALAMVRHLPKSKYRLWAWLLVPISLIQFKFTFTNHAVPYLVAVGGVYLWMISDNIIQFFRKSMFYIVLGVALVGVTKLAQSSVYKSGSSENMSYPFSKENLQSRWGKFLHAPKIDLTNKLVVQWRTLHPWDWTMGMGAGNGTSTVGMSRVSPGAFELLQEYYLTVSGQQERQGNSVMEDPSSGVLSIWSEIGVLGVVLFYGLYLAFHVYRLVRRKAYPYVYQRILAEAFVPSMLVYMMSSFLVDTFYSDFWQATIWIWAGLVYRPLANDEVIANVVVDKNKKQLSQQTLFEVR